MQGLIFVLILSPSLLQEWTMNTSFARHTAVIGRGIIGLSTALRLREQGLLIVIIGRQRLPGSASWAATGVSAMRGLLQPKTEIFRQKLLGHHLLARLIPELENLTKQTIPHDFSGAYEFFPRETYGKLRRRVYHRLPTGLFAFKCLNFEQTKTHLGPFSQAWDEGDKKAAFFYPKDGWFDPESLMAALELRLEQLGVVFIAEAADKISPENSDDSLLISTETSIFRVARVVVAAGAGSENILKNSDIFRNEISYSSGITMRTKFRESSSSLAIKSGADSWLCTNGELRCGGENIAAAKDYSPGDLALAEEKLKNKFSRLSAEVFGTKFTNENQYLFTASEIRAGVRVRMTGDKPWVGFSPFRSKPGAGVWINCGYYKYGFYAAFPGAEKLAALIQSSSHPVIQ